MSIHTSHSNPTTKLECWTLLFGRATKGRPLDAHQDTITMVAVPARQSPDQEARRVRTLLGSQGTTRRGDVSVTEQSNCPRWVQLTHTTKWQTLPHRFYRPGPRLRIEGVCRGVSHRARTHRWNGSGTKRCVLWSGYINLWSLQSGCHQNGSGYCHLYDFRMGTSAKIITITPSNVCSMSSIGGPHDGIRSLRIHLSNTTGMCRCFAPQPRTPGRM